MSKEEIKKIKDSDAAKEAAERLRSDAAELDVTDVRAAAAEYARYLKDKGLRPGDDAFEMPEKPSAKRPLRRRKLKRIKIKPYEKCGRGVRFLSAAIDLKDKAQISLDDVLVENGKKFAKATHEITSTYRNTRRAIGAALLAVTVISAAILIIFDRFTVYKYAYNGKVLGYVKEQEEVTDVLEIAGEKLTQNTGRSLDIDFVPNQNVTFNLVDSGGKSLDDSDTAVNKLIYMTDIETEAYGVYDGDDLVAIVKDNEDAEELLNETMEELSTTDPGMRLVSAEFGNPLDIKPLNVFLTSVQDSESARKQMTEGGQMEIYHIVEEGENIDSLSADYAVEKSDIYDESNTEIAIEPEQGDKVCIHRTVDPVHVKMVETGRVKEVVEFKTVKQESDLYYKGDTYVQQEGRNGYQTFEGTITKEGGVETDREGQVIEEQPKVRDKIILVGTAERPKTAPTGTYAMPIDRYTLTSPYAWRWGRMHTGLDMAAPVGTPIYATDGGTVIRSQYYSSYGNCIDIDHGNGRVTRYAHCSKLLVSVGEQVYQRQNIALVGSTGHSTGPHLHFEVILNGSTVDPAPKLGI